WRGTCAIGGGSGDVWDGLYGARASCFAATWRGPDGRGRPREHGFSTGALAFPGGRSGDRWGERHSHYNAKGRRTAIALRPLSPRCPHKFKTLVSFCDA